MKLRFQHRFHQLDGKNLIKKVSTSFIVVTGHQLKGENIISIKGSYLKQNLTQSDQIS